MSIIIEGEEYFDIKESREFLGVTDQTLRTLAKRYGFERYRQKIASNKKYYKKTDLEALQKMEPVAEEDKEDDLVVP